MTHTPAEGWDGRPPPRVGCGFGVVLGLVAVGCLVVAFVGWDRFRTSADRIGGYPAVPAGSSGTVTFDEDGGKTAYFESSCFSCTDSDHPAPSLAIADPAGAELEVDRYGVGDDDESHYDDGITAYSRDGVDGEPVYTFHVPVAGDYQVAVGPSDDRDATLRFGASVAPRQVGGLVAAVGGLVVGVLCLLVSVLVVLLGSGTRRRTAPPVTGP